MKQTIWISRWSLILAISSLAMLVWQVGVSRAAATITVSSTTDALNTDGACTLREAIIAANKDRASSSQAGECPAGNGADTIIIPAGTYTLTRSDNGNEDSGSTGDLDITASVTLSPTGPVTITANSGFTDRIFHIHGGTTTITGVTIKNGNSGNLGGGIYNKATLTLINSTLSNNKAGSQGGGLYNTGTATLTNMTVSGNTAKTDGGGLAVSGSAAVVNLNNVTVASNTADSDANNTGNGGGIFRGGGAVNFKNTLIGGNSDNSAATKHPDCSGTLTSQGYNLIQITTGCTVTGVTTGNLLGVNPLLGALQNNGGNTFTHALLAGSPATDAGNPAAPGSGANACALTDQRGVYRPRGVLCDIGAFEAGNANAPVIIRVALSGAGATVDGRLHSAPNTPFTIKYYTSAACDTVSPKTLVGTATVTTDVGGDVYFESIITSGITAGQFVTAVAFDPNGNASGYSACVAAGVGNDSWPTAMPLNLTGDPLAPSASVDQYVDMLGQSRWFSFTVQPGSKLVIALTNLPANYDLTIYKDIRATLQSLQAPQESDLTELGAEFAPDAFSPDAFSPDAFSPDAFSPDAFSPDAFSPDAFSPDAFSPDAFSPDAFSPDVFSPDVFSPDAFSPDAFSPDAFSPDAFSPDAFSPDAFSPDAFSSAQTLSLIAASGFEGTASEGVILNTWNNSGTFYIRVRGRNGAFSLNAPFHLNVQMLVGSCNNINPITTPSSLTPTAGGYKTIILTDQSRLVGASGEKSTLLTRLTTFAARPEVLGKVVDVSADARVVAANAQADARPECPYAKNLVAYAIKDLVDGYRALNPLAYVVLIGNDNAIPFFRHPDNAMLANEMNYAPPVRDNTASQASLRLGYVLSQDRYGASIDLSAKIDSFPLPGLAVGRLVETAADATTMLDAYLSDADGVVTPGSALVTGYDFLEDAARAVESELEAGLNASADTLIAPRHLSPQDPATWTATDLRALLLTNRYDLAFLAGHFSANSALAADYATRLTTDDLMASSVNMTNAIIFSAGCHVGYNIVDPHGVVGVTREPDWAQAFARKGATLIGGTGYQYGDTDFIEYSELLYLKFSQQLRTGAGPVSVGQALVAAKLNYLAETPHLRGLSEKALLEATLFGLPMLKVNMPGARLTPSTEASVVGSTAAFAANPGAALGLRYADVNLSTALNTNSVQLTNVEDDSPVTATYLSGSDGTVSNPAEPILPLEISNVSAPGTILRGVGFRGGTYTDVANVLPLIGAATTELRGVHAPFVSDVFYPIRWWSVNYFDALASGGATNLMLTPAQFISGAPDATTGTRRQFSAASFRLYYSDNVTAYGGGSTPALAAAPSIVRVSATPNGSNVTFQIKVAGNPAAGVQEVWVTFTSVTGAYPRAWQSLNLTRSVTDSTLWTGTLNLGSTAAADLRYIVQAANGVGLVALDTNQGAYYIPGVETQPTQATSVAFIAPPTSGAFGTRATFTAELTHSGTPLAGQSLTFRLGPQTRRATTDANGRATVMLSLIGLPGAYEAKVSFGGNATYMASSATNPFTIQQQATVLSLDPAAASGYGIDDALITATLTDANGRRLNEKTVFFVISGVGGTYSTALITDYLGRAVLGDVPLPAGPYAVSAYFGGVIPVPGGSVTLNDSRYLSTSATGSLTLLNTPPVGVADNYATNEDTTLNVSAPGMLGNDDDFDNDPLTAVLVAGPVHGALTLNANGSFTYVPEANFSGSDSFTYTPHDGTNAGNETTVSITINAVNDAPIANNDSASTLAGVAVTVAVLTNDSDIDGGALSVSAVTQGAHGAVTTDGVTATYTPTTGFSGLDTFTYTVSDGNGGTATATVTITVTPVNQPPVCSAAVASPVTLWPPDKNFWPVSVLNVTDPDGNPLTITITAIFQDERVGRGNNAPDGLILGPNSAKIRAERDGNGNGRVYHLFFTANDGQGGTCSGHVRAAIVPHDQGGTIDLIDGGPLYDSTIPD